MVCYWYIISNLIIQWLYEHETSRIPGDSALIRSYNLPTSFSSHYAIAVVGNCYGILCTTLMNDSTLSSVSIKAYNTWKSTTNDFQGCSIIVVGY